MNSAAQPSDQIFISYSRDDIQFVCSLIADLNERGIRIWYDGAINGGERWPEVLAARILAARAVVVVLSPASIESDNVRNEIDWALHHKKHVIPFLHGLGAHEIPFRLVGKQVVANLDQLVSALGARSHDAAITRPHATGSLVEVPFHRNSQFIDRQTELGQLAEHLRAAGSASVTAVHGLRGVGKSHMLARYVFDHIDRYSDGVSWIDCRASIADGLHSWSRRLPHASDGDSFDAAIHGALEYLESKPNGLIIFDNVPSAEEIDGPFYRTWSIGNLRARRAVTTAAVPTDCRLVRLRSLSAHDSLELLLSICGREPPGGSERQLALNICRSLGGLPFAIRLMASYFRRNQHATFANATERVRSLGPVKAFGQPLIATIMQVHWDALEGDLERRLLQVYGALLPNINAMPICAAEIMAGAEADEAAETSSVRVAIKNLVEADLAEIDSSGCLRVNPLVAHFARAVTTPDALNHLRMDIYDRVVGRFGSYQGFHKQITSSGSDATQVTLDLVAQVLGGGRISTQIDRWRRVLSRQADVLRTTYFRARDGAFAQQLAFEASVSEESEMRDASIVELLSRGAPHLKPLWHFGPRFHAICHREVHATPVKIAFAERSEIVTRSALLAADAGGVIRVVDVNGGHSLRTFSARRAAGLSAMAFAESGLLLGYSDGVVQYHPFSGEEDWALEPATRRWKLCEREVLDIVVLAGCQRFVTHTWSNRIYLCSLAADEGEPTTLAEHEGTIQGIAALAAGGLFASVGDDQDVLVWDGVQKSLQHRLLGHEFPVHSVAASGGRVASGSASGKVLIHDCRRPTSDPVVAAHLPGPVDHLAFTTSTLLAGTEDRVHVLDTDTGQVLATIPHEGQLLELKASREDFLCTVGLDGTRRVWDARLLAGSDATMRHFSSPIELVSCWRDSTVSLSVDGVIRIFDSRGNLTAERELALRSDVLTADFDSSRGILAIGTESAELLVVGVGDDADAIVRVQYDGDLQHLSLNGQRDLLVVASGSAIHTLKLKTLDDLHRVHIGVPVRAVASREETIYCGTADGSVFAIHHRGESPELIASGRATILSIVATRSGVAVAAVDGSVCLIDRPGSMRSASHWSPVYAMAPTQCGEFLVTGGDDRRLAVWRLAHLDVDDLELVAELRLGHKIHSVAVSERGGRIVVGNEVGQVHVFALHT